MGECKEDMMGLGLELGMLGGREEEGRTGG